MTGSLTQGDDSASSSDNPQTTSANTGSGPGVDSSTTMGGESGSGQFCTVEPPPMCDLPAPRPRRYAQRLGTSRWGELEVEAADDAAQGGGFIPAPDGGGVQIECDLWSQDCPAGQKCNPFASDGGNSWNATGCFPLDPNPVEIGEPCTAEGGVSGIDNCAFGAMCFDVDLRTNEGTCVELCQCNAANPGCATPGTSCAISNDGVLPLCLPLCNPLDPNACPDGHGCVPSLDYFHCVPDASSTGGAAGDPCESVNACDAGLYCAPPEAVPGCEVSTGCCSSLCTNADDSACLPGQACVDWYVDGRGPDECLTHVGACASQ